MKPVAGGGGIPMPPELRETFESMKWDISPHGPRLDVIKDEAPEQKHSGHGVRIVQGQNAEWYQRFAGQFTANRRKEKVRCRRVHDTLVKRRYIHEVIERWLKNGTSQSKYAEALIEAAEFEQERLADEEAFWQEQMEKMDSEPQECQEETVPPDWEDDVPF